MLLISQDVTTVMMEPSVLSQLAGSSLVVWLIDYLKRTPYFPLLTKDTQIANQIAAVIGAALTAAGIHFVVEPSAVAGSYTIAVTGLTFAGITHFLISLASQQTLLKVYQGVGALREIINRLPPSPKQ